MERDSQIRRAGRLDLRQLSKWRQRPLLARCCAPEGDSACSIEGWNPQEDRLAYVRHTYSTLQSANGENVKVVQELMRHASSRFTLEVYSQAQIIAKRQAQQRLVQALFPEEVERLPPVIHGYSESIYHQ